jgi:SIT4-associating protein SAP185/190
MMWKFSFAQTSNIDSLFTREHPPDLEEVLDQADVLAEIKAQNNRYVLTAVQANE